MPDENDYLKDAKWIKLSLEQNDKDHSDIKKILNEINSKFTQQGIDYAMFKGKMIALYVISVIIATPIIAVIVNRLLNR